MSKVIDIKMGSCNNKGDELMLLAIIQHFEFPDYHIAVKPQIADYHKRATLGLYQKLSSASMPEIKNFIGENLINKRLRELFGIILESEVEVVLDASGYAYGDNWGEKKIQSSLNYYSRVKKNGGKVIFLPQTFGPFIKTKQIFTELANCADLICARDKTSYENLLKLDIDKNKIRQFPDFTRNIKFPAFSSRAPIPHSPNVCIIPNHRMLDELGQTTADNYRNLLLNAAELVQKTYNKKVLFLFHEKEDLVRFTELMPELQKYDSFFHEDPYVLRKIVAGCDFVISSRFHGILTSFSSNVPCIGTSWSHKFDELFEEYTLSKFMIKPNESERLEQMIGDLFNPSFRNSISTTIEEHGNVFHKQVEQMWDKIFKIINS